jgi:phosphinothricin acetyltransferase
MKIINFTRSHSDRILEILNDAIVNSTALYDYAPRHNDSMRRWFEVREECNFPVVGLIDNNDELLAFGSFGTFRAWPAYKYTIEHSLYVHKDHRGKGYGRSILEQLIEEAKVRDYHNMIAGIDSQNMASKNLHEKLGFQQCARIVHAGYKFSRWLDLEFYQLILPTPSHPIDG